MKITSDMKVEINTDNSSGKYIAITKKGNTLTVNRTAKKPRGGAKATLEKIQKILEVTDVNNHSKTSLAKIAVEIDSGYAKKNDKKFLYKIHSKKVHKVADRIAALTTTPEVPADVFSVLGSFADAQTLGRLAQVNKAAAAAADTDWTRRAKALGWPGEGDPKAFCKGITKELDKLGLRSIANQLISNPEMDLDLKILSKIGRRLGPLSKSLEPLLNMLVAKTKNYSGPMPLDAFHYFFNPVFELDSIFGKPRILNPYSSNTLLPYASLMAQLGVQNPNLIWFAAADIDYDSADTILNLFPAADLNSLSKVSKYSIHPLSEAIFKGNLGWAKAFIEKNVNVNQPWLTHYDFGTRLQIPIYSAIKSKNTEMISLLVEAGADIPKTSAFIYDLIRNNPSNQVMLILDRLSKEEFDSYTLMNTYPGGRPSLLNAAIRADHSREVLEKLVEMGAELNPTDRRDSPLLYAQKHKKTETITWLIDQGAVIPKR